MNRIYTHTGTTENTHIYILYYKLGVTGVTKLKIK